MRFNTLKVMALVFAVLGLSACQEKERSVDFYQKNPKAHLKQLEKCDEDRSIQESLNCKHAELALEGLKRPIRKTTEIEERLLEIQEEKMIKRMFDPKNKRMPRIR